MNHQVNHPEPKHALDLPAHVGPSALEVFGRLAAVLVAALLVLGALGALAASVPAVGAVLAMAAFAVVVAGAIALPFVLVEAVAEAL
jgi:hypothetical protein